MRNRTSLFILIFIVLISCPSFTSISHATESYSNLLKGLVGYWKFDEGSGITAIDSSGCGNNGILINNPLWTTGVQGSALFFDGNHKYVQVEDSDSLRLQHFTLYAWIYLEERPYQIIGGEHHHSAIINKLNFKNNVGTTGYKLQFEHPTSVNDHLVISIGDGIQQRFLIDYNSINDLTLNRWHCVVGTYDGSTAKIYIDGILKATANVPNYIVAHDSTPLALGAEPPVGVRCDFKGIMDNVMIYNRALTLDEVRALSQLGDYITIDQAFVSDERADIGSTQKIGFHLKWNNGSDCSNALVSIKETKYNSKILFYDDFERNISVNWIEHLGTWKIIDGKYFVSVGTNGISTVAGLSLADYTIETKLRFTDSVGYRAGIVFRYTDTEHYYSFEIGNEYDEIDIIKYSPIAPGYGEKRTVIQPSYGNSSILIQPNVDYILKIEVKGNKFTAFLNGQKVLSWTDDSYSHGGVGLRARRADVYFDYFTVYSISTEETFYNFYTNSTGWITFDASSLETSKSVWTVSNVTANGINNYLQNIEDPAIIWDKVNITLHTEKRRVDVGKEATINYTAVYEYDRQQFSGSITLNDTLAKYSVGEYGYTVSSIRDRQYGLTAFNSNSLSIIFDKLAVTLSITDDRIDVGSTANINYEVKHQFDNSPSSAIVTFNDTVFAKDRVGKWAFTTLKVNDDNYGITVFDSNTVEIIWDRVRVILSVSDDRIEINSIANLTWKGFYEYDGEHFSGSITLNDNDLTQNHVGKKVYKVSSINDPKYNLRSIITNEVSCIFDRIKETVEYETLVPGSLKVKVKLKFEYDGKPVDSAIVRINGLSTEQVNEGVYQCVLNSWAPYFTVDIQIDELGFNTILKSNTVYLFGNLFLETFAIACIVLTIGLRLKAKREKKKKQLLKIVKDKERIDICETASFLGLTESEVRKLLFELLRSKQVMGTFTSDGKGFVTEEKLKKELFKGAE